MSKPLTYTILSQEQYEADKASMLCNDLAVHRYFAYDTKDLNDTEQIIASLRCLIPDPDLMERFQTLATERGVTSKAYSEHKVE
jgi:hypothetical protein